MWTKFKANWKSMLAAIAGVVALVGLAVALTLWSGKKPETSGIHGLTTLDPKTLADSAGQGPDSTNLLQTPRFLTGMMDPLDSLLLPFPMATDAGDVQIQTENDRVIVELSVPDLKESSLHIEVDQQSVQVSGEQESVQEQRDASGQVVSRSSSSSSYSSRFTLPEPVSPDGMTSHYKDGVLHIEIPRLYKEA
jgi:HSP20 family molecular chaperone IbpA